VTGPHDIEDLLRTLAPQVLGALVRRSGHFDAAEDAVQEALLAAVTQWPDQGVPDNPRAWLITVAGRRLTDRIRSEQARRHREELDRVRTPAADLHAPAADAAPPAGDEDDSLVLFFLCCHPAVNPASQVALTLRAIGGLTTAEIAHALLLPEATLAQRISRAKQRIRAAGATFRLPADEDQQQRLAVVRHVLYLIFNEGYTATSGTSLHRAELTTEAIRLTRLLHQLLPDDAEVTGLLALMLLTDARRPARTGPDGELVPLAEQDRSRWDTAAVAEGVALLTDALPRHRPGPYQLQAAIAALHDEAERAEDTDWPQIAALYAVLDRLAPDPLLTINRAVAVAAVHGPRAGLELLEPLGGDGPVAGHHRLHAVRAHLLEQAGDHRAATEAYRTAARLTTSLPEQRYLSARAARLG
jgi:RNA polymerase sigma factor (sigma-70 family)